MKTAGFIKQDHRQTVPKVYDGCTVKAVRPIGFAPWPAVIEWEVVWEAVSALVLMAAVMRVVRPGCKFDEMVVLESGEQGHGYVPVAELEVLKTKVNEFRDNNVNLKKELEAERATRSPDEERVTELTAKLAASEAARVEAQSKADASVLKSIVTAAFLKAGGRQKAADYILGQAKSVFTVENGELKTTQFSPSRPGQSLTLDEFLLGQTKESDFAFEPSRGSGAGPLSSGGGTVSNVPELRDPTPEQLGRHADEIMAGRLRVVTSS